MKESQTITHRWALKINNGMEAIWTLRAGMIDKRQLVTWRTTYMWTLPHIHIAFTHMRYKKHAQCIQTVLSLHCIYSQFSDILCWYSAWFTSNGWKTVLRDQTLSHGTAINKQHGHYLGCLLLNGPHTWFKSAYPRHVHFKLVSLRCLKSLPTQLTQQWLVLTSLINKEMSVPSGLVLRDV